MQKKIVHSHPRECLSAHSVCSVMQCDLGTSTEDISEDALKLGGSTNAWWIQCLVQIVTVMVNVHFEQSANIVLTVIDR